MIYEIRLYDPDGPGLLLFEADAEAQLAKMAADSWPEYTALPYESEGDGERVLIIWKDRRSPDRPHAVAWKARDTRPWTQCYWRTAGPVDEGAQR